MVNGYNNLDLVLPYVVVVVIIIIIIIFFIFFYFFFFQIYGRENGFHCINQYGSNSRDNLQSLESANYKDKK